MRRLAEIMREGITFVPGTESFFKEIPLFVHAKR